MSQPAGVTVATRRDRNSSELFADYARQRVTGDRQHKVDEHSITTINSITSSPMTKRVKPTYINRGLPTFLTTSYFRPSDNPSTTATILQTSFMKRFQQSSEQHIQKAVIASSPATSESATARYWNQKSEATARNTPTPQSLRYADSDRNSSRISKAIAHRFSHEQRKSQDSPTALLWSNHKIRQQLSHQILPNSTQPYHHHVKVSSFDQQLMKTQRVSHSVTTLSNQYTPQNEVSTELLKQLPRIPSANRAKSYRTSSSDFLNQQYSIHPFGVDKKQELKPKKSSSNVDIHRLTQDQFKEDVLNQQKSIIFINEVQKLSDQKQMSLSPTVDRKINRRHRSTLGFFYKCVESINENNSERNSINLTGKDAFSVADSFSRNLNLAVVEQKDGSQQNVISDIEKKKAFVVRFKNFNDNLKQKLSSIATATSTEQANSKNYQLMRRTQLISSLKNNKMHKRQQSHNNNTTTSNNNSSNIISSITCIGGGGGSSNAEEPSSKMIRMKSTTMTQLKRNISSYMIPEQSSLSMIPNLNGSLANIKLESTSLSYLNPFDKMDRQSSITINQIPSSGEIPQLMNVKSQSTIEIMRLWTESGEIATYFGEMRESVKHAILSTPLLYEVISEKLLLNVEQFLYLLTHFWRVCLSPPDESGRTKQDGSFFKIDEEYIEIIRSAMQSALENQPKLDQSKTQFFLIQFRHLCSLHILPKTLIEHLGGDRNVRKIMNQLIDELKNDISMGSHFSRLLEGVDENTASRYFQSFLRDEFERFKSILAVAKAELNITSVEFLLAKQLFDNVLTSHKLIKPTHIMTILEKFEKLRPYLLQDSTQLLISQDNLSAQSLSVKIRNSSILFATISNKQRSSILSFSYKVLSMLFGSCSIRAFIDIIRQEFNVSSLPITLPSSQSNEHNSLKSTNYTPTTIQQTPSNSRTIITILNELETASIEIVGEFMKANDETDTDYSRLNIMKKHAHLRFQFVREDITQATWHARNIRNHGRRIAEDLRIWAISNFDNYLKHIQLTSLENSKLEAMGFILKFYFYRDAEVFSFQDIPVALRHFPYTATAAEFWMVGLKVVLADDSYTLSAAEILLIIADIQKLLDNPFILTKRSSKLTKPSGSTDSC